MNWQLWLHRHCYLRQLCLCLAIALEEVSSALCAESWCVYAQQIIKFPDLPPSPSAQVIAWGCFVPHPQLIQLTRANHNSATAAGRALPWQRVAGQCQHSGHRNLSSSCPAGDSNSRAWTHTEWEREGEVGGQVGRKENQTRILIFTGLKMWCCVHAGGLSQVRPFPCLSGWGCLEALLGIQVEKTGPRGPDLSSAYLFWPIGTGTNYET